MKGRSRALVWVKNLKNRGITEFKFHMLPEDVRDWSSFKKAIAEERIIKIVNNRQWGSSWRIKV